MKHVAGGNCWEGIKKPQDEDICLVHEEPRGACEGCLPCPACEATFKNDGDGLVEIVPTMSKTDALLACQYPWGRRAPRQDVGEPAHFGNAFHEVVAGHLASPKATFATKFDYKKLGRKHGVDGDEVKSRVLDALPVLVRWLTGENAWKTNFTSMAMSVEQSVAWNIKRPAARFCAPPDPDTHIYPDREKDELCGTADLVCAPRKKYDFGNGLPKGTLLVLDHKTGYDVPTPAASGQLRSLALALASIHGCSEAIVAFLHAPKDSGAVVYADPIDADELIDHKLALQAAWKRIGDGSLRPGSQCDYCPAFLICPTQSNSLVELHKGKSLTLTRESVGFMHQKLAEYDKLAELLRDEMRPWIRKHGPGLRPDGKLVDLVPRPFTSLSMTSIKRALGEVEGARMIAKLEKLGCIEHGERDEMRAVADKG